MATQALTIELRDDLAEMVREKVASGEYATAGEVVADGLEALLEEQAALTSGPAWDKWVREDLLPSIAEYQANPSVLIPIEEVKARLAARHARRSAA
jgi:Arc/MetJ-type ribon-helix-helix transcriptional regulator